MTPLAFGVVFHGPFHIATGSAGNGADLTVDADSLLPASSLKGVMRAAAANLLGLERVILSEIFGATGNASPWSWSDGHFSESPTIRQRSRIAIGDDGVVADGALQRFDEVWAETADFTIDQYSPVAHDRVDSHRRVLAAAAAAVTSLGADRNRGFGWVTIKVDTSAGVDGSSLASFLQQFRTSHG